jgi:hypothetical protein
MPAVERCLHLDADVSAQCRIDLLVQVREARSAEQGGQIANAVRSFNRRRLTRSRVDRDDAILVMPGDGSVRSWPCDQRPSEGEQARGRVGGAREIVSENGDERLGHARDGLRHAAVAKSQVPSTKSQRTTNLQLPIVIVIGNWHLGVRWSLGFGAWDLTLFNPQSPTISDGQACRNTWPRTSRTSATWVPRCGRRCAA